SQNAMFTNDSLVLAFWNNEWYRASVVNPTSNTLRFVVFGNVDTANRLTIMPPDLAEKPTVCLAVSLDHCPRLNPSKLQALLLNQLLSVKTVVVNPSKTVVQIVDSPNIHEVTAVLEQLSVKSNPDNTRPNGSVKNSNNSAPPVPLPV